MYIDNKWVKFNAVTFSRNKLKYSLSKGFEFNVK